MPVLFQPVQREATNVKVASSLRQAIFSGQLKTGQRLAEIPLAKQFRVSRAVVREALQLLAFEGVVEINPFRGAQVIELSAEEAEEIGRLRLLLEAEAFRLARVRLTPAHKNMLRQLVRDLDAARDNAELFAQLDFELHKTIWELTGNRTLVKHLTLLCAPIFSTGVIVRRHRFHGDGAEPVLRRGEHRQLVEIFCEGAEDEAVEAIRHHISENWDLTVVAVDKLHQSAHLKRPSRAKV